MDGEFIERAAIGRMASLGDLYDAHRDSFCSLSLFDGPIPAEAVKCLDHQYSNIQLLQSDSSEEKFSKMKVNAELQVSLLTGLVSAQGSGLFLTERKTSEKGVKCSLLYRVTTVNESLNINSNPLEKIISLSALDCTSATHVVTEITWGANCILSCVYQNNEGKGSKEMSGKLISDLEKVKKAVKGGGNLSAQNQQEQKVSDVQYEVMILGDILPRNKALPTTVADSIELLKNFPALIETCNAGKGKPLIYRLVPLSYVRNKLKTPLNIQQQIKSIDNAILHQIVQMFDQVANTIHKLSDLYNNAQSLMCLDPEEVASIASLRNQMELDKQTLKTKLSGILIDVRSGRTNLSHLENFLENVKFNNTFPERLQEVLPSWNSIKEKIEFATALVQHGAIYIGADSSLDMELLKDFENTTYVFYFQYSLKDKHPDNWNDNKNLFFSDLRKRNHLQRYLAVDVDIHSNLACKNTKSCYIKVYQSGKIVVEDLLETQRKLQDIPFAQATCKPDKMASKPNKRVPFSTPCFGNNCNPSYTYDWICSKCQKSLDYGFDKFVYCRCGQTKVTSLEFKCIDPGHGVSFEKPDEQILLRHIKSFRAFKEINILILGETGVGKSTWINGFANFLRYESLADAERSELCGPIPTSFTVCDENYEETEVSTGVDTNEVLNPGESATQETKVYPFPIGDCTVRLIDTPGIGDTRGIEQDEVNFENILGVLSHLDEIHGICILLKPNNARLNIMFRFCIKELLANLHKDASKNILFCFTNTRGTFYRPGDTMPALRKLLKENDQVEIAVSRDTIYCFDSEAYRFLAAVKNDPPVKFSENDRLNFANSWEFSVAETQRMLEHIKGLEPHKIKNTLSLNQARDLVVKLSKPLDDIIKNIQLNKSIVEQERADILKAHVTIEDLKKRQNVTRTDIEVEALGHAQTVCSNSTCMKTYTINDTEITEYVTVCDAKCSLGVGADSIGSWKLRWCGAMNLWGTCTKCGHSYSEHLHIFYKSSQVQRVVEDAEVSDLLNQNLTAAEIKQEMLDRKDNQLKEFEYELAEIESASVKFAYFLKKNAIAPYNDAREQYLRHYIREEKNNVAKGASDAKLAKLEQDLASYKNKQKLLEAQMAASASEDAALTPKDIDKLVKDLQKLKHSGSILQKVLECVEKTQNVVYRETIVHSFDEPKNKNATESKPEKKTMLTGLKSLFERKSSR